MMVSLVRLHSGDPNGELVALPLTYITRHEHRTLQQTRPRSACGRRDLRQIYLDSCWTWHGSNKKSRYARRKFKFTRRAIGLALSFRSDACSRRLAQFIEAGRPLRQ